MGYGVPSRIGNLAAAGPINTVYQFGRVTHLLFSSNVIPVAADKCSLTLRGQDEPERVLINNVSLLALAGISDFQGGFCTGLQTNVNASTGATDFVGFFYAVAVGNLDLRSTQSELAIQITWSQAAILFVSAVAALPDGPDYAIKTLEQAVLSVNAMDVEAIFVYYETGSDVPFTDAELNDVNITVEAEVEGASNCTLQDCYAFTCALGEIEANAPRNIICIYQNMDEIPDNVKVQLSGSDADTSLRIIVQSREYMTNRMLKSAPGQVERLEKKVSKYGVDKQVALNMNGVAAPAATLQGNKKQLQNVAKGVIAKRTGR
jgi:hypothetical protein